MRDLELFREHMSRELSRRLRASHVAAAGSESPGDYQRIVAEAKAAEVIRVLIGDIELLEKNPGEFVKRHIAGDERR